MKPDFTILSVVAACLLVAGPAAGQLSLECSVLDSSGNEKTAGAMRAVTAGGQPGGILTSSANGTTLYAGFLGCILLQPDLDTDGDGLANELDTDNDNDELSDFVELAGSAFIPGTVTDVNNADSDGDGNLDGHEAATITNPLDDAAYLHITDADANQVSGEEGFVEWFARGGSTYRVYVRSDAADSLPGTLMDTVLAVGGGRALVRNHRRCRRSEHQHGYHAHLPRREAALAGRR